MSVGSVSSSAGALAAVQALRVGSDNVKAQIGTAVLAQIQDGQEAAAQALVQMIKNTPSPEYLGRNIDVRV